MLKIRLRRIGRKNNPSYKIVIAESLTRRDGKFIENIGYYNPVKKQVSVNFIKLIKYINVGAQPTNTVRHLIYKIIRSK